MAGEIYRRPGVLAAAATATILIGSIATMAYPMLRSDMHPRLEALKPFTALQLAGRDVYQREGCNNCHTQVIRPLPSEVARYGAPSQAGEYAYDHPFLWGSKRTGPDLAREGGLRPDRWHHDHFANPQAFFPRSNMPSYGWLKGRMLDAEEVGSHLKALASLHPELEPDAAAVRAQLAGKDELDALVAYMQWLGHSVPRRPGGAVDLALANPLDGDPTAIARGKSLFGDKCAVCHGEGGEGQEGVAPSLEDAVFLGEPSDMPDAAYFAVIGGGSDAKKALGRPGEKDGGMPAFGGELSKEDIWAIVAWIRSHKAQAPGELAPRARKP
jgi:cytochrome c oxidase cbb3-type subunit 2